MDAARHRDWIRTGVRRVGRTKSNDLVERNRTEVELMTSNTGRPWKDPKLLRFLYISSAVAAAIILVLALFLTSKTWYLNQYGTRAPGTILERERNGQGWRVMYQMNAAREVEVHVDWVPEGSESGDSVDVALATIPLLTPQLVGTPVTDALPLFIFAGVPVAAGLYYRRLHQRTLSRARLGD